MEGIISQPTNNSLRSGAIWATKETSLPKKRNLPSPTSQIPHGIGMGCFSSEISSELSSFYPVLGVQLGGVVQLWVGHGKFAPHQATPFPRGVGFPGSFEGFRGCRNWWNIVAFTGRYDWISLFIPWKKVKKWITVGVAAVFTPPFPHQHLTQGPVCFAQNFAEPAKDWILRKNTPCWWVNDGILVMAYHNPHIAGYFLSITGSPPFDRGGNLSTKVCVMFFHLDCLLCLLHLHGWHGPFAKQAVSRTLTFHSLCWLTGIPFIITDMSFGVLIIELYNPLQQNITKSWKFCDGAPFLR